MHRKEVGRLRKIQRKMKKDGRLLFYFCNQKKKDYFNLIFSIDLFGVELLIHASLWFYLVLFVQF